MQNKGDSINIMPSQQEINDIIQPLIGLRFYPEVGFGGVLFAEIDKNLNLQQNCFWDFHHRNQDYWGEYSISCHDTWQIFQDNKLLINRWWDEKNYDLYWDTIATLLNTNIINAVYKNDELKLFFDDGLHLVTKDFILDKNRVEILAIDNSQEEQV